MRRTILAAALFSAVVVLSACGEQQPAKSSAPASPAPAPAAKPAPAPAKPAAKPVPQKTEAKPARKQPAKPGVVTETAQAIDKTADYATGRTQLQAKKRMQNKLQNIQQGHQDQYNKALQD